VWNAALAASNPKEQSSWSEEGITIKWKGWEMPTLQIVITDAPFPETKVEESVLSPLKAAITVGQCRTEDDVMAITRDADAVIVQWAPISRRVIEHLTHCRIISRYGVGVDMIDLEAARDHNIQVANVPDFCVEEVATHTLGFLVALGRKIVLQDRLMRQGVWKAVDAIRPVNRFRGQTLGLVGVGKIGRRFAELAAPLSLRILGYDIQPPKDPAPVRLADFETVIRESDFLSLHCPLTKETQHLINAEVFKKMKPGAFLINMARGGVVDTAALLEALSRGQIAGAALDVFEQEPLPPDHPLTKMDNVILTPHLASYSLDAVLQLRKDTARNVLEFFQEK
jgi:D-3-phosphoglycerate dehydrogenase